MDEENSTYTAKGITWNLDELYQGVDDSRLDQDLRTVRQKSQEFVDSWKGKLNEKSLDPHTLRSAIQGYELIQEMGMKPYTFAYLYQSSNVQDHGRNRLLQKVTEDWNDISQMLAFFPLQIMALPEDFLKRLATHNALSDYRHFLLRLIQWKPYTLSEMEERALKIKNLSGRKAFVSFYDEIMGSLLFPVNIEGQCRHLTTDQVLSLLHSQERWLREKAFEVFLEELGRQSLLFKHILNSLILDHHLENIKRGHPSPMHAVHLSNGVNERLTEMMLETVENHYALAQRYFRLKARLLGLERLKNTDLLAPLRNERIGVSFSMAKQLLLEAMGNVHPQFQSMEREFFEGNWIDAETRAGKKGGAFCKCFAPSLHPFASINYEGNLRDVAILAHELGHGLHYRFAAKQSYLNFSPPPVFAETASTFNEIILTQHLIKKEQFQAHLPALLSWHMEGILITVYRQNVLTRFEQAIHRLRQDHLLDEEEICQVWLEENERLYGEDVHMIPAYRWGWTYISHFVHRPFYCYSYIFGNLLSIILYQNYMEKGEGFLEKIISLFSVGCCKAPLEMLAEMGLDPGQKSFWQQAFQYVRGLIDALEMRS